MNALQTLFGIEIRGSSSAAMGGSVRAEVGACAMAVGTATADNGGGACATAVGTPATDSPENGGGAHATAVGTPTADSPENGDGRQSLRRLERQFRHKGERRLASLQNLTNLKKLSIYRLRNFNQSDDELLLAAIEHLSSCSLKFLAIDDSFTGFLDRSLNYSQAPPEQLHTLELSGKLSNVPNWIRDLHNVEKLTLSLTSLTTDTLPILGKLPELFSLTFSLDAADNDESVLKILHKNVLKSEGKIFVPAGGFEKLKLLCFSGPVLPPLSFLEGAMPELQRLELRFRMVDGVYGLENLASLQQMFITVSSQAPQDANAKASQIKALAGKIGSSPTVVIEEYNESSKEQ